MKSLGELCKKAKSGGTPKSTIKEYYDGNIPFLSISDITEQGKYLYSTEKTISKKGLENSTSWIVPIDSIIYTMYASVGFVSMNKIELYHCAGFEDTHEISKCGRIFRKEFTTKHSRFEKR